MVSDEKSSVDTEQIAARAAVMEVPLYPDLSVQLKKALGYGPHVDMLQHLAYWFHPRHPKMKDRWTLYKTFEEWYEECGLTDRQVKKGRKKLVELGLLTWKRGQYSRVYYRVSWSQLAEALNLQVATDDDPDDFDLDDDDNPFFDDEESIPDTVGVPIENDDDNLEDFIPDTIGVRLHSGRFTDQAIPDTKASDFIPDALPSDSIQETTSGDYSVDYLTEETPLQGAADTLSRTAAEQINKEEEESLSPKSGDNKRHPEDSDTTHEEHSPIEEVSTLVEETKLKPLTPLEVNDMVHALFNDNNLRRAAMFCAEEGESTVHGLAVLLCRHLGKPEDEAQRFEARLPAALDYLREEVAV